MKKILLSIMLMLGAFFTYSIMDIGNTEVSRGEYVIEKGDNLSSLPKRLKLDVNVTFYKIWLKIMAKDINLLAGTYSIKKDTSLSQVLNNDLKKPVSADRELTILPGWNIFDIDELLAREGVIEPGELIAYSDDLPSELKEKYQFLGSSSSLEGFIYPETYRIPLDASLADIVNVALETFEDRVYDRFKGNKASGSDFYEILILASIVEREERKPQNKPVVAGILAKRLDEGISIGADATVCYQYKKTFKECTPEFIGEKIYIKSKYNTRNKIGLPPTPISNMTDDTFIAALEPEASEYYYYLHDMQGEIHYGKSLDDHNRNKNKYLN